MLILELEHFCTRLLERSYRQPGKSKNQSFETDHQLKVLPLFFQILVTLNSKIQDMQQPDHDSGNVRTATCVNSHGIDSDF